MARRTQSVGTDAERPVDEVVKILCCIHQCGFCIDIARAMALQECGSLQKIEKLERYREDPAFTPAERAALAYVEEVSRTKTASDATFEASS